MSDTAVIRVLVVDDHQVVRQGFAGFIQNFPDLIIVGEAANGEEAIIKYNELKPDVLLLDLVMPVMNGIEATRVLRTLNPDVRIIALTAYTDNQDLVRLALSVGVTSFLYKDISAEELANALRLTYQGMRVLAPAATRLLLESQPELLPINFNLSEREMEVLQLLGKGFNNPAIAKKLGVSRSTIKFHVSSILGKLGAISRTEAVSIAHQYKLIT